jgi:hypothetical protein
MSNLNLLINRLLSLELDNHHMRDSIKILDARVSILESFNEEECNECECSEVAILDCPFCGGGPDVHHSSIASGSWWIQCANCDAKGQTCDTPSLAICGWNARA